MQKINTPRNREPRLAFIPRFSEIDKLGKRDGFLSLDEIKIAFENIYKGTCFYADDQRDHHAESIKIGQEYADKEAEIFYNLAPPKNKKGLTVTEYNAAVKKIEHTFLFESQGPYMRDGSPKNNAEPKAREVGEFLWDDNYVNKNGSEHCKHPPDVPPY